MKRHHDEPLGSEDPFDRELRQALAGLSRERAAAGFTERVLRRLDETPSARFRWQPVLAGAALAAAAVAVLLAAGVLRPASRVPETPGPALATANGPEAPASPEMHPITVSSPEQEARRPPTQGLRIAGLPDARSEADRLLEELRREHARLERDLRDLRELAEGSQVLYVGGDESLDFVLDLASEPAPGGGPDVRPASLQRPGPGDGLRFF